MTVKESFCPPFSRIPPAPGRTGAVEQRLRLLGIELVELLDAGVVPLVVRRDRPVGGNRLTEEDRVHERLAVDRHGDGLPDVDVVEAVLRLPVVQPQEVVREAREARDNEVRVGLQPLRILRRRVLHDVDRSALDLVCTLPGLEDRHPLDRVEIGGARVRDVRDVRARILVPAVHDDLGARLVARERKGPGAVGTGGAVGSVRCDPELPPRDEIHDHRVLGRERLRERRERRLHRDDDGRRVGRRCVFDRRPEDRVLPWPVRVLRLLGAIAPEGVEVVRDHLRVDRSSRMEHATRWELERPREQIVGDRPRVEERRLVGSVRVAHERELVQRDERRVVPARKHRVQHCEVAVVALDQRPALDGLGGRPRRGCCCALTPTPRIRGRIRGASAAPAGCE